MAKLVGFVDEMNATNVVAVVLVFVQQYKIDRTQKKNSKLVISAKWPIVTSHVTMLASLGRSSVSVLTYKSRYSSLIDQFRQNQAPYLITDDSENLSS